MAKYSKRGNKGEPLFTFEGVHKALGDVLRAAARKTDVVVRYTGGGHYKIDTPNGPVLASSTPRVPDAAAKRLRRDLRAKGVDV